MSWVGAELVIFGGHRRSAARGVVALSTLGATQEENA